MDKFDRVFEAAVDYVQKRVPDATNKSIREPVFAIMMGDAYYEIPRRSVEHLSQKIGKSVLHHFAGHLRKKDGSRCFEPSGYTTNNQGVRVPYWNPLV